jgi:hypothetical protein
MNFSGVWKLPVVFVVNNNQWAISVPLKSPTLAQKAIAAGFCGEQVDGNDIVAVRAAADAAIASARTGAGPRLIEAVTYRLGDHTTADDASRYRPAEEVKEHWKEEPIARLRAYPVSRMNWSKAEEEKVAGECEQRVDAAIERYLESKPRPPQTMFDHLYARLPAAYAAQLVFTGKGSGAVKMINSGIAAHRAKATSWLPFYYAELHQFTEAWCCIEKAMTAVETCKQLATAQLEVVRKHGLEIDYGRSMLELSGVAPFDREVFAAEQLAHLRQVQRAGKELGRDIAIGQAIDIILPAATQVKELVAPTSWMCVATKSDNGFSAKVEIHHANMKASTGERPHVKIMAARKATMCRFMWQVKVQEVRNKVS